MRSFEQIKSNYIHILCIDMGPRFTVTYLYMTLGLRAFFSGHT